MWRKDNKDTNECNQIYVDRELQEYLIICVVEKMKNKASGTSAYDLL